MNGFRIKESTYWALFILILASVAGFPALAHSDTGHRMFEGWGSGHMTFGIVPMALFWLALIVVIVTLIRWSTNSTKTETSHPEKKNTAVDILKERFARGEIDKQEYEQAKKILSD